MLIFVQSSISKPVFISRLFLPASLLVPILLPLLIEPSRHKFVRGFGLFTAAVFMLLALISTLGVLLTAQKDNWRGAYRYVKTLPESSTRAIVFVASEAELPFNYYRAQDSSPPRNHHTGTPHGFFEIDPPRTMERVRSDADLDRLRQTFSGDRFDDVVLVMSHEDHVDKQGRTLAWFEANWQRVDELKLPNIHLMRYARRLKSE